MGTCVFFCIDLLVVIVIKSCFWSIDIACPLWVIDLFVCVTFLVDVNLFLRL